MINNKLEKLTDAQFTVLVAVAMNTGYNLLRFNPSSFVKGMTGSEVKDAISALKKAKVVESTYFSQGIQDLSDEIVIEVVAYGWYKRPAVFQKAMKKSETHNNNLFQLADFLLDPSTNCTSANKRLMAEIKSSGYTLNRISIMDALLRNDNIPAQRRKEIFALLSTEAVDWWLLDLFDRFIFNGKGWPSLLDEYSEHMDTPERRDMLKLFSYLYSGANVHVDDLGSTWPAYTLLAVKAAQQADQQAALKLHTAALKLFNKYFEPEVKNIYGVVLLDYYLMLATSRGVSDDGKKLKTLLKKNYFQGSHYRWLYSLGSLLANPTHKYKPVHRNVLVTDFNKQVQFLIERYTRTKGVDAIPMPTWMAWRLELSPWLDGITDDDRAQMEQLMGKPVLAAVKRMLPWEANLESLDRQFVESAVTAQPATRVVYYLHDTYSDHGMPTVEPMRQKWLEKSQRWSAPTLMRSIGDSDTLTNTDRAAIDICLRQGFGYTSGAQVLPLLVGCDRVFTNRGEQVTIDKEDFSISVKPDKNGNYTVTSNVPVDMNVEGVVRRDSATHYTVVRATPGGQRLVMRLQEIDQYPPEAADALRRVLLKASKLYNIESPLVNTRRFRKVEGSATLSLMVTPRNDTFTIAVNVRPWAGAKTFFTPGEGTPVYSEQDPETGEWLSVSRNRDAETENLNTLSDILDNLAEPEMANRWSINLPGMIDLLDYVNAHPEVAVIEWAEGKPLRLRPMPESSAWNIGIQKRENWFEVEGEVRIDENTTVSVAKLLGLVGKDGFVKLADGDYLRLSATLRKQLRRLQSIAVNDRGHMRISPFKAPLIEDRLDGDIVVAHDQALDEMRQRIDRAYSLDPQVPRALKATLRPYQLDGFRWLERLSAWGAGACLADDMGLGKTIQAIALMLAHAADGPALVVAPASVVPNWRNELQRFAPSLNVVVLNQESDREAVLRHAAPSTVVLTTYGLLNTQREHISARQWGVIVLDEAHTIKNRETKMSAAVMSLQGMRRVILTGTPLQNRLAELWNLFQFINPGLLGTFDQFRRDYITPIEVGGDRERRKHLQRLVQPFMLRRTKNDVLDDLPPKTEITIPVELTTAEMTTYEAMRLKAKEVLEKENRVTVNALSMITRLRQAACDSSMVDPDAAPRQGSKIESLIELLTPIVEGDSQVLVFSQFTKFLELVRQRLDKEEIPYLYLDGSTPIKERERLVARFQSGERPVFLISLRAGGLGLNLTAANYVVHLDPWWNPAIEQQATDRAYRIGQRRDVTIYRLIAQHTIEEKILRLHATKRDIADAMLEGTETTAALTAADYLAMLNDTLE